MMKPSRLIAFSVVLLAVGAAANITLAEDVHVLQGPEVCKDACINARHPQTNSGTSTKLNVFRSNVPQYSSIKFDLSKLPKDRAVKDVALMLFMTGETYASINNPMVLEAHVIAADWREDQITWLNRTGNQKWKQAGGDYDGKKRLVASDIPAPFGKGWIVLKGPSLTRLVNLWISGQKPNYGLMLRAKGEPGGPSMKYFVGSENRDPQYRAYRPKLIVSYDQPVNPADHGYISDAELLKRPLREKLKAISDSAEQLGPELKAKIKSLAGEIERLTAADDARSKVLEKELAELRLGPIRELWPGKKIIVWPISPWEKLSQDQIPRPGSAAISTRMLQNEYQELSLALTNISKRDQTLSVTLSVLDDYPAGKLTLRAGYWIPPSIERKTDMRSGGALPPWTDDPLPRLANDRLLKLKAGQTRRLFLTVNSNDVKDGTYQLGLKIASKTNKLIAEVPVQVQVLPLSLLKDKDLSVHTYAYLQRPSTTKYMALAVKDLKAHYQNTYIFNLVAQPKVDEAGNIVEKADYSKIREQLRLMQDAKMIIHFWHEAKAPSFLHKLPWLSDPWKKALRNWLPNYVKVLREEGFDYDRFMLYPFDESYDNPVHGGASGIPGPGGDRPGDTQD